MNLALNECPMETAADAAAAVSFAAAIAFAGSALADANPILFGLGAFAPAFLALRRVAPQEMHYVIPAFANAAPDGARDELFLTEQMMVPEPRCSDDELILDDALPRLGLGSQVVRLFEPSQIPANGALKPHSDMDRDSSGLLPESPDAAQALSDALAQLRRSLR